MEQRKQIKPGLFGLQVSADSRRGEFDIKNEVLLQKNTPIDYLFFGDSITHFWELNAYFHRQGQHIINRGIGGDNTVYAARRFEADVIQLKPKLCICMIGVNDAWDLEYDPWSRTEGKSIEEVLERALENYRFMMQKAKEHEIRMAVCSVLPTNMDFTNHEQEREEYIVRLNSRLKEMCREFDFLYVDYHSGMVQENGKTILDGITCEGLHSNVKGYDIMAGILADTLAENGYEI